VQSEEAEEIYTIWTTVMLMGTVQKHILRMYFPCSQLIAMPVSGSVSSVQRFESTCRFLHFIDNSYQVTYEGPQKLLKMCPIIRHLNSKFNKTDESLTLWKDSLSFNLYLPLKLSQFRKKKFILYESSSGYLWSSTIYTGKKTILESSLI
jgi:hypothetical protein